MKKKTMVGLTAVTLLAACATTKVMQPIGGSRSDGTVKLAYEYGAFENPKVDAGQAAQAATARCQAWGYQHAEPFGGYVTQCTASNGYGCVRTMVTVEFQCTGANTPS